MRVWAIADLHLSFGVPDKEMDLFGEQWIGWTEKIKSNWNRLISQEDLVLIAGDISWAISPEKAAVDLEWIHHLPGTKLLIRGNHDYWWTSLSKVNQVLPDSLHLIQNNVFMWNGIAVGGARLWDTPEFNFKDFINYRENPRENKLAAVEKDEAALEKIFLRELNRLELSLKEMPKNADYRIAMTHYPPVSADMQESRASKILEKHQINTCVFGHLHNVKQELPMFGEARGVKYMLTSCDYLDFVPVQVL